MAGALAFPNVVWPDEIFQTLEQAHRLAFGYGIVPWEFRAGARSWLLPGLLAGAMEAGAWAGGLGHLRAAQLLLSALSLAPVAAAFLWGLPRGRAPAAAAAAACGVWYELVLFAPKALGEVVAAHLLIAGLFLASRADRQARPLVASGAALALAAALRIQLAPAVAVAAAFACRREAHRWRSLALGAAPVVAAAGLLDLATWSGPFHSYLATFRANVIEQRSRMYGIAPWHAYFAMLGGAWSWAVPALVALGAIGGRRRPDVAATAIAVVATHVVFAHKEYRFVYPAVALVAVLAALGTAELVAWTRDRARVPVAYPAVAAVAVWGAASLAVGWRSPLWTQGRSSLEATRLAGARAGLCGLGLVGQHWASTGGYTYLHRDVPIYAIEDAAALRRAWSGFDAALVSPEYAGVLSGFTVERCWEELCLARRPGSCTRTDAPTLNDQLVARDE